jgi:signal transduction histidine kinase
MAGAAGSRPRVARWLGIAVGAATPVVALSLAIIDDDWTATWSGTTDVRWLLVIRLLSIAGAAWGGVVLLRRRARPTIGLLAVALGVVLTAWSTLNVGLEPQGWRPMWELAIFLAIWPLVYGLVLTYPLDRPDRWGTRILATYVVLTVVFVLFWTLVDEQQQQPFYYSYVPDPVRVIPWSDWTGLARAFYWWIVGSLLLPVATLIALRRRQMRWPGARSLARPAWIAGLVVAGAELLLLSVWTLWPLQYHGNDLTPYGLAIEVVNLGRLGVPVLVLAVATGTSGRRQQHAVDLDATSTVDVQSRLRSILGDSSAHLLLPAGEGWIDSDGHSVTTDRGLATRSVTTIVRGDEVVAAIDHDAGFEVHPAVLEGAAVTVALDIGRFREAAMANAEMRELREVGRAALHAEDRARRRLELDLHDGAQQSLVALALEAGLSARSSRGDRVAQRAAAERLARSLEDVAGDLVAVGRGRGPALLASSGLAAALDALAAITALDVDVDVSLGSGVNDGLDGEVRLALWFAAAEATANALKHAEARRVGITVVAEGDDVALEVGDDGRGGVDAPPRSIVDRLAAVGGTVEIDSPPGRGTRVVVRVPVRAGVPA